MLPLLFFSFRCFHFFYSSLSCRRHAFSCTISILACRRAFVAFMYSSEVTMKDLMKSRMGSFYFFLIGGVIEGRVRNRVMESTSSMYVYEPPISCGRSTSLACKSTKKCSTSDRCSLAKCAAISWGLSESCYSPSTMSNPIPWSLSPSPLSLCNTSNATICEDWAGPSSCDVCP